MALRSLGLTTSDLRRHRCFEWACRGVPELWYLVVCELVPGSEVLSDEMTGEASSRTLTLQEKLSRAHKIQTPQGKPRGVSPEKYRKRILS